MAWLLVTELQGVEGLLPPGTLKEIIQGVEEGQLLELRDRGIQLLDVDGLGVGEEQMDVQQDLQSGELEVHDELDELDLPHDAE